MKTVTEIHRLASDYLRAQRAIDAGNMAAHELRSTGIDAPSFGDSFKISQLETEIERLKAEVAFLNTDLKKAQSAPDNANKLLEEIDDAKGLPARVLAEGRRIETIKNVRVASGLGLKAAKALVDAFWPKVTCNICQKACFKGVYEMCCGVALPK